MIVANGATATLLGSLGRRLAYLRMNGPSLLPWNWSGLAVTCCSCTTPWRAALANLVRYLEPSVATPLAEYYREVWAEIASLPSPDWIQVERFLSRLPYT